jgi:hypothetical protein
MRGMGHKQLEALVCWRTLVGTSKRRSDACLKFRLALEGNPDGFDTEFR